MNFNDVDFRKRILSNIKFEEDYFLEMIDESQKVVLVYVYYLIKENNIEKAKNIFYKITPLFEFQSYYVLIEALLSDSEKQKVEKLYKSLELDRNNIWTLFELYCCLKDTDDSYLAYGYLDIAIEIESDFYEAKYERILNLNSVDNCEIIIQEILSFPETYIDENILNTLAFAFFNCYDIDNAEKILFESIKIKKTKEAFFLLGIIYFDKYDDKTEALNYYNRALEFNPNDLEVLTEKAWLLFEIGKVSEAENIFLKMLEIMQNKETYNQVIHFYFTVRNYDKAFEYLNESKKNIGINYSNEGYEILYFTLIKNNAIAQKLASYYKKKYSTFEIEWLKGVISEFGKV